MNKMILLSTAALVFMAGTTVTQARGIKSQIDDATLATYCGNVGVNTETTASFTIGNGSTITGSVHCEAEDLIVGSDDINDLPDDSDFRPTGNKDGGSDDPVGHDSNDDNGGDTNSGSDDNSSSGSDNSGSDDHSGHDDNGGHGSDDHGSDHD